MRRVGDELALGGDRVGQCRAGGLQVVEHGVEAIGHAPDLVVAAVLDAAREVVGRLDVLGRVGHLGDRRQDLTREQAADGERERGADETQERQDDAQPVQRRVRALEAAPELDRPRVTGQPHRMHA